jgi:ABC-2 type transport system permease protein
LALENFSIMWPLLVIFMVIAFAGTSLAGEIEKGTMSLTLSRPVSRTTIFVSKYLAGLVAILFFNVISIYFIIPLSRLHNVTYILESYTTISVLGFFFSLAIFSLSSLFSALFSEKSKVYMVMGGIMFSMYIFNVVANLRESWEDFKYFSFFHYFNYNQALFEYEISWESLFVFGITIIVSFVCGILIFKHRDIAI